MLGTMTLKQRIILLFLINSLIPIAFAGIISYDTIYSILGTKIQDGIRSNLKQVAISMENSFQDLNHVSQQLAYEGTAGKKLNTLLTTDEPFEISKITAELKDEMNLITFTNPDIGLNFYYFRNTGTYEFESLPVKDRFAPERLPLLSSYSGMSYYGPHRTNFRLGDQYVISALRKVELPGRDDVFVYIESGYKIIEPLLDTGIGDRRPPLLFLNGDGTVVYSQIPEVFPNGSAFRGSGGLGKLNGYYWFRQASDQGWYVVSAISEADYNKEIDLWFKKFFLTTMFILGFSLCAAWLLWKMVYKPMKQFNAEIRLMADQTAESAAGRSDIPEFDMLLKTFAQMKQRIWDLIAEIENKEKRRLNLEVEKLLYQINPHFLMNTLNTVHWLAMVNGQTEIDRVVQSLNKLLYYNLGKLGEFSNVGEEINALEQYLTLQQIRYDFEFNVQIDVDEETLRMPIPRFILQPIVENALYHGFIEDGYIQVNVRLERNLEISICDNGVGMSEETIEKLLRGEPPEHKKAGMGIGMNYVKRMLEAQYEGRARLHIESNEGSGTRIHLSIPVSGG